MGRDTSRRKEFAGATTERFIRCRRVGSWPRFHPGGGVGNVAVLIDSQTLDQLAEIDLQDIRVDGDVTYHAGSWFMTSVSDELVRLDFATSTAAVIGPTGISDAFGLVSGPDGRLYATTEQELMVVDTQTGAVMFAENLAFADSEEANGLATWREALQWTAGHSQLLDGQYLVTVGVADNIANVDFGFIPQAEIVGRVFDDANENGQVDSGDLGIDGFWVFVDLNEDGDADSGEPRVQSSGDGGFRLPALPVGQYQLRLVDEPGRRITSTSDGIAVVEIDGTQDVVTVLVGVAVDAPPRVASVDPASGSQVVQAVTSIALTFTGPMDPATVWAGTFVLVEQGADQRFDTPDDQQVRIRTATLDADPHQVILGFDSALPRGSYRLTIRDFMVDQYGNAIDGEFTRTLPSGDGVAGGGVSVRIPNCQLRSHHSAPAANRAAGRAGAIGFGGSRRRWRRGHDRCSGATDARCGGGDRQPDLLHGKLRLPGQRRAGRCRRRCSRRSSHGDRAAFGVAFPGGSGHRCDRDWQSTWVGTWFDFHRILAGQ